MVFGLPGRHVFPIYDALRDSPIRHVGVLHEAAGAQMADMYGRLTGRAGVCLFTGGPGATNALTALAQAYDATSLPPVSSAGLCLIFGSVPNSTENSSFSVTEKLCTSSTKPDDIASEIMPR